MLPIRYCEYRYSKNRWCGLYATFRITDGGQETFSCKHHLVDMVNTASDNITVAARSEIKFPVLVWPLPEQVV